MKKKSSKPKTKRLTLSLSKRDYDKLTLFAKTTGASRPLAAKRLLSMQLSSLELKKKETVAANQLGLFDSLQIDIFDNTSKVGG